MTGPITGYTVVLQHYDRSGLIGTFGPYPTEESAKAAIGWLEQMPIQRELFEVVPQFGAPGLEAGAR